MKDKKHGKQKDYDLAHIRVEICKTKKGLFTHHQPDTTLDKEILDAWPSGGMVQVASALINEGIKREIYLAIFSYMSQEKSLDTEQIKNRVYSTLHKLILQGVEEVTPTLVDIFQKEQIKTPL